MDTRRLRYFVQVAASGSITRAAQDLGVAQPALSQQMAILETELGVRLLERSTRGIRLTSAGEALLREARPLMARINDLPRALSDKAGQLAGPVLVGIPPSLSEILALPLVVRISKDAPGVRLQLIEEGGSLLEELLQTGELEIAVTPRAPPPAVSGSEMLFTERVVAVIPIGWSPPAAHDISGFAALPWVTTRRTHSARLMVEAAFTEAGFQHRVVAEIDSLRVVVRAVELGVGMAMLPESIALEAAKGGQLKIVPFGERPFRRPIFLCTPPIDRQRAAAAYVIGVLRTLAKDVAQGAPERASDNAS